MSEKLALKIKDLLNRHNFSVQGFEKKAGLRINVVRSILTGDTKKPSAETLLAVSKALNCSISDLLDEEIPSERKGLKIENVRFSQKEILLDVVMYMISFYKENNIEIESLTFISLLQEIYNYLLENNDAKFDAKFAKWLLSKHFG